MAIKIIAVSIDIENILNSTRSFCFGQNLAALTYSQKTARVRPQQPCTIYHISNTSRKKHSIRQGLP